MKSFTLSLVIFHTSCNKFHRFLPLFLLVLLFLYIFFKKAALTEVSVICREDKKVKRPAIVVIHPSSCSNIVLTF